MEKIIVDFGRLEDGWLIIKIKIDDFELEIDTSDVPHPIEQLCSSITHSLNNLDSEVLFSLEPNFNVFRFFPKIGLIRFQILFLENNQEVLLKEMSGNFKEIVLPFYRAIKMFSAVRYEEKQWEQIEKSCIEDLTNLIHKYKYSQ